MTFYLKYRPQKISELDLLSVRETLTRILSTKDIPHAFLFSGPRGAGKTSAARIVAKMLNCEVRNGKLDNEIGSEKNTKKSNFKPQNPTSNFQLPTSFVEPCNECDECVAITKGASLDVIEIDAASNRGVDDIRSLREGVKLSPASADKKVYIIDEAHMLTTEASNALLKTLEEPPSHVVFILATTNPGKLLDTIRSRTTNVVFPKATQEEIVGSLEKAVKGEKINIEKEVLKQIAKSVDGSFREAHKVLEQVSLGREKVTVEDLEGVQGISADKLLEYLKNKDAAGALGEVDNQISSGTDPKQYAIGVVSTFRQILLSEYLSLQGSSLQGYKAEDFGGTRKVQEAIELFSKAAIEISSSPIAQLPIELAVVGMLGGGDRSQSTRLGHNSPVAKSDTGSAAFHSVKSGASTPQNLAQTRGPGAREQLHARPKEEVEDKTGDDSPKVDSLPTSPDPSRLGRSEADASRGWPQDLQDPLSSGDLDQKWKIVMQTVKPQNHSIEALLRATRPRSYDGKILTLEVFYKFHKERIEKDPYRSLVEAIAQEVWGEPVVLSCHLSVEKQTAREFANITEEVEQDIVAAAENIFGVQAADSGELPN